MGLPQVGHVDIIADARAVRGRIVRAEDGDIFPSARGRIEHKRYQMRFGIVIFADFVVRIAAPAALK